MGYLRIDDFYFLGQANILSHMKNKFKIISCLVLASAMCSCSKDEPDLIDGIIESGKALDVGNNTNSSDIYVELVLHEPLITASLNIIIVKTDKSIRDSDIVGLSPDQVHEIDVADKSKVKFLLKEGMLDTENNPLQLNTTYQLAIVLRKEEELRLTRHQFEVTLTNSHYLLGDYLGKWNDNIYTDFPITAKITNVNNNFASGRFFYSGSFSACCGGPDDGAISFRVEDQAITSFRYDQNLPTYMGGCPGEYNGSGVIEDFSQLQISFSGTDCDGIHAGGKMILSRIK